MKHKDKNNRPAINGGQGTPDIVADVDTSKVSESNRRAEIEGKAAAKMAVISKRRIKHKSQVTRQHGKVKKDKYIYFNFHNDPETMRINEKMYALSDDLMALARMNVESKQIAEAKMIARHNKVKLPPKRRKPKINMSIDQIENLF